MKPFVDNTIIILDLENPPMVVEEYDGYTVVSDPIPSGSKVRFCNELIKIIPQKEIVFGGGNPFGLGPAAMAFLCQKYNKKAVFFAAKRNDPTPYQKMALNCGAEYHWLNMGMLTVCQARAREYTAKDPDNRFQLPLGLEHPTVIESIVNTFRGLQIYHNLDPVEVWSVGSSGTINRGLQEAFPFKPVGVIQIGHDMSEREIGRAKRVISVYKWNQKIKLKDGPILAL